MKKDILIVIGVMTIITPILLATFSDGNPIVNVIGISSLCALFALSKFTKIGKKIFINFYRSTLRLNYTFLGV